MSDRVSPRSLDYGPGADRFAFAAREMRRAGHPAAGRALRGALRELRAWRRAAAARRKPVLPPPPPDEIAGLDHTLDLLRRTVRGGRGPRARETLALACAEAARWAEERGAFLTAAALLEEGAALEPERAHFAYGIGRLARRVAQYEAAEEWLRRAHGLARRLGQWDVATLAVSGLGNLHRQRGNLPRARRHHSVARRMARRHGLRTLEGDALYDLAVMAYSAGDGEQGAAYVRAALEAYGPEHSKIYRLAHDVASCWMHLYGRFEDAGYVFTELLGFTWQPSERALLMANLARASAGAGWGDVFEASWTAAFSLLRSHPESDHPAAALVQLAQGAAHLKYWHRARMAAAEALQVATNRREAEFVLTAEALLQLAEQGVRVSQEKPLSQPARVGQGDDPAGTNDLAIALVQAMRVREDCAPMRVPSRPEVRPG